MEIFIYPIILLVLIGIVIYNSRVQYQAAAAKGNAGPCELLACDCNDCAHWLIVRLPDGTIHLHCKTCERRDELDSFTVHEQPNAQVRWVARDAE